MRRPISFQIPMRGNESLSLCGRLVGKRRWTRFQIPMRGNEEDMVVFNRCTCSEFQIPMRGNEKKASGEAIWIADVSNPHEG